MLAGVKQMCNDKNAKAVIYQFVGMVGEGYSGAAHPFTNAQGLPVAMNEYMFKMLKPLLEYQDYIQSYEVYEGQEFAVDLDKFMLEVYTGTPKGSINRWIFHAYPQMSCDLSKAWLEVPNTMAHTSSIVIGKVLINHTFRYRNYLVKYFFLKKYQPNLVFTGLREEYELFCNQWGLYVPLLKVDNFLELAAAIRNCKFFSGNQSMAFQIAEATKTPRVLEIFEPMPNVIPTGANSYDYYHQGECEFYFDKLFNLR